MKTAFHIYLRRKDAGFGIAVDIAVNTKEPQCHWKGSGNTKVILNNPLLWLCEADGQWEREETMHVSRELSVVLNWQLLTEQQQGWEQSVKFVVLKCANGPCAQSMSFLDGHGVLVAYPTVLLAPIVSGSAACLWTGKTGGTTHCGMCHKHLMTSSKVTDIPRADTQHLTVGRGQRTPAQR